MTERIAVLGAGSWGTALAVTLSRAGKDVVLHVRRMEHAHQLEQERINEEYLPGYPFPENLNITANPIVAVQDARVVLVAVPSQSFRHQLERIKDELHAEVALVSTAKGFELETLKSMSQVAAEVFGKHHVDQIAVLSGPTIAEEVAHGLPAAAVIAAHSNATAQLVQEIWEGTNLRTYTSTDVMGVEVGGALKNIIAIAAGVCEGLGLGDNSKAAIMTRGLAEMTRMGKALGADPLTFLGLSGIGDCILTCMSPKSRNHRLGISLGKGLTPADARLDIGPMVAEGDVTAKGVYEMARKLDVDMPIADAVFDVLHGGRSLATTIDELLSRVARDE